jgi:hypothetical protein
MWLVVVGLTWGVAWGVLALARDPSVAGLAG